MTSISVIRNEFNGRHNKTLVYNITDEQIHSKVLLIFIMFMTE